MFAATGTLLAGTFYPAIVTFAKTALGLGLSYLAADAISDAIVSSDTEEVSSHLWLDPMEASHRKNKAPSNKPKHEDGEARRARDQGGEKGDKRRPFSRTDKKRKKKNSLFELDTTSIWRA